MENLSLNEPAGVLIKTTCVDYPGRIAGSFFLKGCNLRCPYCYNTTLVLNSSPNNLNTVEELFSHMEKRKGILSGIVISGGEPLLNPYTPQIIKKAKELGYKVKLDTNGTLPQELQKYLNNSELQPDFIAMDIKTSPSKYGKLLLPDSKTDNSALLEKNIISSIKILSALPQDSCEFRTVLVPGIVAKDDIECIGKLLPEDASWQFAQFMAENCLNPSFNELTPYTDEELQELLKLAKTYIKKAELR